MSAPPRPLVGPLLVAVGAAHTALTPLVTGPGFRALVRGGVVDAVRGEDDEATDRAAAFWFATTGVGLSALGWAVTELERRPGGPPGALPLVLAGLGIWGAVPLPRSPFWVLVALGGLAESRRRRSRAAVLDDRSHEGLVG